MNYYIKQYAYNAVFGGVYSFEFLLLTLPALITLIIDIALFVRAIKKANRVYTLEGALMSTFGFGLALYAIDWTIIYLIEPLENNLIMNSIAIIVGGLYMAIPYILVIIIPFSVMTILLYGSHAISTELKLCKCEKAVNAIMANRNYSNA